MAGFYLKLPWQQARYHPLEQFPYRVGRSIQGELEIPDPCVSRRHFVLHRQDGLIMLFDQKSMGGTQVNGVRVNETALKDGDIVHLGETILQFCEDDRSAEPYPLLQHEYVLCLEERGTIDFFYSLSGERTYLVNVADRMDIRTGLGYDSQDLHQLQVQREGAIECHRLPFQLLLNRSLDPPSRLEPGSAVRFGSVSVHVLVMDPFPLGPAAIQRLIRRQKFLELLEGKSLEQMERALRDTPPGPERSRVLKNTLSTWLSSLFSKKYPDNGAPTGDDQRQTFVALAQLRPEQVDADSWKAVLKTLVDSGGEGSLTGTLAFYVRDPERQRAVLAEMGTFVGELQREIESELERRAPLAE